MVNFVTRENPLRRPYNICTPQARPRQLPRTLWVPFSLSLPLISRLLPAYSLLSIRCLPSLLLPIDSVPPRLLASPLWVGLAHFSFSFFRSPAPLSLHLPPSLSLPLPLYFFDLGFAWIFSFGGYTLFVELPGMGYDPSDSSGKRSVLTW